MPSSITTKQGNMDLIRFQLVYIWALCQSPISLGGTSNELSLAYDADIDQSIRTSESSIPASTRATLDPIFVVDVAICIWITYADSNDLLAMTTVAKSSKLQERCPCGLHSGIVHPNSVETKQVSKIFSHCKIVLIYDGANTICLHKQPAEVKQWHEIRILITPPCTDLALAIRQSNQKALSKIDKIYWSGGFDSIQISDGFGSISTHYVAKVSVSWYEDLYATKEILRNKQLKEKILICPASSHVYVGGMNKLNFPRLFEKLKILYDSGVEEIVNLLEFKDSLDVKIGKSPIRSHEELSASIKDVRFCANGLVAAIVMLYDEMPFSKDTSHFLLGTPEQ
uniref:AlNc14C6G862 protein n=1 Tax=Albugo laibachii Nc14 TaxID=890382 RepID=F0W193_9STRA|nr:AlNc14C6G862 [Albugo laibachii Nc14]|eukprot:CCA14820.1 AlNc14C6G862 [Albugo laibachii Nc14]